MWKKMRVYSHLLQTLHRSLMRRFSFVIIFCFFIIETFSQNSRDKFINDSIINYRDVLHKNGTEYNFYKLIRSIETLEKMSKSYEPDFRYHMVLSNAYKLNKLDIFKKELEILVEKYGFDVAYMSEKEVYYDAITTGKLSSWFKKMYLKKHFVWLKNNFEKQIDLKKLNSLHEKDQLVNSYSLLISQKMQLDSVQRKQERETKAVYAFNNALVIHSIANKYKSLPTSKSFALIQNPYSMVELHNMQNEYNFDKFYNLFLEYYKSAYLRDQINFTIFSSIDFHSYVHHRCQIFGLITKKDILDSYLTELDKKNCPDIIPIKDIDFYHKIKLEFKWF